MVNLLRRAVTWVRSDIWVALSLGVYVIAAYLCLANLDYVALWYDEAPVAVVGKNLLEQGDIVGWDGRNLVGGRDGIALNEELRDVAPPVQYVLTAAGFATFGIDEFGARVVHALAGILALGLFYLVLRQHFARYPRLMFFMFLFAAWSAQLLLYFRQARYYSVAVLAMMASFYLYERYWQTRRLGYLGALTLVLVLGFFNHYAIGTAMMLALAVWHLLFRMSGTTKREWLMFSGCGAIVGMLGLGYLYFIGLVGSGREASASFLIADFGEHHGGILFAFIKILICVRDLFQADWVSWLVFVWFACALAATLHRRRKSSMAKTKSPDPRCESDRRERGAVMRRENSEYPGAELEEPDSSVTSKRSFAAVLIGGVPILATSRIVLMGALFAVIMPMLSPQPFHIFPNIALRYYVPALMFLLAMKGLFAEWVWRKSRIMGAMVIFVLLFTSIGAAPFSMKHQITDIFTLGAHFPLFVREIHRPYRDAIGSVSDYLLGHAEQDDLVFVPNPVYRDTLAFYIGHRVLFCGIFDPDSKLARDWKKETLEEWRYAGKCNPDWIVTFVIVPDLERLRERSTYVIAERLDVSHYLTQRPEINFHTFVPPLGGHGVHILRRKDTESK